MGAIPAAGFADSRLVKREGRLPQPIEVTLQHTGASATAVTKLKFSFMRRKSQAEKDEFVDAGKKGWVSIKGMYADELTGLCPEELIRLFRYSGKVGKSVRCPSRFRNAKRCARVHPGHEYGDVEGRYPLHCRSKKPLPISAVKNLLKGR